jgi:hypothetical protein
VRRLLIALVVVVGATLIGLLLASLLLKQECPDCGGMTRYFAENPGLCVDGPAVLDCPRCNDGGRVSLLEGLAGSKPDPLVASLLRHSHRGAWKSSDLEGRELSARIAEAGLTTVVGPTWAGAPDLSGSARFVRDQGRRYVLFLQQRGEGTPAQDRVARILLFSDRGMPLDAVRLTAFSSISNPVTKFVIPPGPDGLCARISLLVWKNSPYKGVEIHHAGKVWKGTPDERPEKLGLTEWSVAVRNGRLDLRDARGKSIPE